MDEPMRGSWNDVKMKVGERGDRAEALVVQILDGWMNDYVRDDDWMMGTDERSNMSDDIMCYRRMLRDIVYSGFEGSGGGEF